MLASDIPPETKSTSGEAGQMRIFVDTNVLVYTRDSTEPEKQGLAQAWISQIWTSRAGCTSVQVLNEFYVTVTRKLNPAMPAADARADVVDLQAWDPVPLSAGLLNQAWAIEDRFRLSYWDSLIVAAAQSSGCSHLLTEDLQDAFDIGGVTVVNPFIHPPEAVT